MREQTKLNEISDRLREIEKELAEELEKQLHEKQKQFQNILRGIGFELKLKPYIQRSDGSAKGDWDVGITIDVIEHAKDVDVVVLASGDGDFDLLMNKIRNDFNVSTEVYGVADLTARSLINSSSSFIPIERELLL